MFKLQKTTEYDWPVEINIPVDGGEKKAVTCTIRFRVQEAPAEAYLRNRITEVEYAATIVVGWDGVGDENGDALAFNDENRDAFLAIPYVRQAVVMAYLKSVNGQAQRKNSKGPHATGF